jgi:hypothetical protein
MASIHFHLMRYSATYRLKHTIRFLTNRPVSVDTYNLDIIIVYIAFRFKFDLDEIYCDNLLLYCVFHSFYVGFICIVIVLL